MGSESELKGSPAAMFSAYLDTKVSEVELWRQAFKVAGKNASPELNAFLSAFCDTVISYIECYRQMLLALPLVK